MEWLTERFNAVQEALLELIEQGSDDLDSQIKYWNRVREENVLMYYGRKEGLTHIGLQPLPVAAVSEYKAKQAIHMVLLLQSLKKSAFANEPWTLQNASAELIYTQPKDCFKKDPYTVEVWFDNNKHNSFPYVNWNYIYYQDTMDNWQKVPGLVDYNGLYYDEIRGDRVYFVLFDTDAQKYGHTGTWTVLFKNHTLVAPISSSSTVSANSGKDTSSVPSTSEITVSSATQSPRRLQRPEVGSSTGEETSIRRRRRRQQREPSPTEYPTTTAKRRRGGGGGGPTTQSAPSPEDVGSRHRSVTRKHLTRLELLQEEARDPPIIIVTGPANILKCWRYRKRNQNSAAFLSISTIFYWVGDACNDADRAKMLIAFRSDNERADFLKHVPLPKHTSYAFGSLDNL